MEHPELTVPEPSLDSEDQRFLLGAKSSATESQGIVGMQNLKSDIASWTPEKTSGAPSISCSKETNQLPEKNWSILEFFNRMMSSLRLLGIHKKMPTFQNICSQVQRLTGRKFEYKHLAQIKYIMPEAIQINKILIHEKETMCMKPDINVTLLFDVVEGHSEPSAFIALSNSFASRLTKFFSIHPEGETRDIPQALLPEPFNQTDITSKADQWPVELSTSKEPEQVKLSHFGCSFNRCFSVKAISPETGMIRTVACPLAYSSSDSDYVIDQEIDKSKAAPALSIRSLMNISSVQETVSEFAISSSTPVKVVKEKDDLMLETPAQPTPKRVMPTPEDKEKTMVNELSEAGNQTAKRSLDFSKLDCSESSLNLISHELKQSTTLLSTSGQMKGENGGFCNIKCEMSKQGYMHADEQKSDCLSDLILTIHHMFQSTSCSLITKEELVHKIIMNNWDIDENSNIEGQIEYLEKLVPDWIHKQVTTSGHMLYKISPVSDLNSVKERVLSI